MEGEPAAGTPPKALATTSTLPMWVQIVVALAGAIGALLVAVVAILKIFFPGTSEGTEGGQHPLPSPAAVITPATTSSSPATALQSEAEEIAKELWAGQYDTIRAKFSAWMLANLPTDEIRQDNQIYIVPLGKLNGVHAQPVVTDTEGQKVVNVVCNAEKGNLLVIVAFNTQEKVNGLWVRPM
jgi:Protein of unknown function (DUF3887)